MSTAIQYRMNAGIPGDITRQQFKDVEPQNIDPTNYPTVFGVPVVIDSGTLDMRKVMSGDTAANIYGMYVRPYPTTGNGNDGLGVSTPPTSGIGNVLKKGYMSVLVTNGTAVKDQPVYTRVGGASGAKVIGDIEASPDVSATAAAHSGNTGNGAISAVTAGASAQNGVYNAICEIAGSNAATFNLYDPNGNLIDQKAYSGSGAHLVFANSQIGATITDGGTDFIVGDSFQITVVANTIVLKNTYFMGNQDALGNAEIAFNI